jgi:hypothetical protein
MTPQMEEVLASLKAFFQSFNISENLPDPRFRICLPRA